MNLSSQLLIKLRKVHFYILSFDDFFLCLPSRHREGTDESLTIFFTKRNPVSNFVEQWPRVHITMHGHVSKSAWCNPEYPPHATGGGRSLGQLPENYL